MRKIILLFFICFIPFSVESIAMELETPSGSFIPKNYSSNVEVRSDERDALLAVIGQSTSEDLNEEKVQGMDEEKTLPVKNSLDTLVYIHPAFERYMKAGEDTLHTDHTPECGFVKLYKDNKRPSISHSKGQTFYIVETSVREGDK
jgi:hypothetical protein